MIVTANRSDSIKLIQKVDDAWSIVEPEDESVIRFIDGMDVAFPAGVCLSLNGKAPVSNDNETPKPIILVLTTAGILSGHHLVDQSKSADILQNVTSFPEGNLKDLVGSHVPTPVKSSEGSSSSVNVSSDKKLPSTNLFSGEIF